MGKALNVGTAIATGGASIVADKLSGGKVSKGLNGVTDLLLGKKDPGTEDEVIDLADPTGRAAQSKAIGLYGNYLDKDPSEIARNQVVAQENQAIQNSNDSEIKARQLVAQRGLGNSSVGLNAILGQKADLGNQIGTIRAQQPALENQIGQQNLNFASQGINQILNEQGQSKIFKQGQASQGRQGGLMPLIGAGVGAYLGGPAGAKAGLGVGQAATQIG